ncbi:MAG: YbaB/EbfC family nucleoid-associated protein [Dermatophilaceae bacterium]
MEEFDDILAQISSERRALQRADSVLASNRAVGRSRDRLVAVRLGGAGRLDGLDIDPDALDRHDHRSLAAAVLEAWNDATSRATRQLADACPEIFGSLGVDDRDGSTADRPTRPMPDDATRPASAPQRTDVAVQAWERGIA